MFFCGPAIRYIPVYTIVRAKEAAWLTAIPGFILGSIFILIVHDILKKHNGRSFLEIINEITGKHIGSIISIIYFIWITILLVFYFRMFAEKILISAMPNLNTILVLVSLMLLELHVLKTGIVPISKMGELFLYLLGGLLIFYSVLILPEIKVENLLPIRINDALPITKASIGYITLYAHLIILIIFNDKVEYNRALNKMGIKTVAIMSIISFIFIATPIAVFSSSVASKLPLPFFTTMMQINLFDIVERIESGLIIFWGISEFIMIAIFLYSALHILRKRFKLNNVKSVMFPYLLTIFFLSLSLANSSLEMKVFSEKIITPLNIVVGVVLTIIIYILGKIRKKI